MLWGNKYFFLDYSAVKIISVKTSSVWWKLFSREPKGLSAKEIGAPDDVQYVNVFFFG